MISVVIADDHELVRRGIAGLLRVERDVAVVGEAADGAEALRLVEQYSPDVLIVDIEMPELPGLEVIPRVRRMAPRLRVIVLSMHAGETYVAQALRSGAAGYVLKSAPSSDIVRAVHQVAAGRRFLSAPLSDQAIETYMRKLESAALDVYDTLTAREREVLLLAAQGKTNAEIAAQLFISTRTVESHRANLTRKLGLRTHTDLVLFAVRRGLIGLG
ncbi:MAG TPA: response regulator transcription factor [Thermoanaerobaculia bacterium]|nr:response regulator transcription factor [Thermoanaerobaculia bacterium]